MSDSAQTWRLWIAFAVGHYGRPDVFTLTVNTAPQTYLDLDGEEKRLSDAGPGRQR